MSPLHKVFSILETVVAGQDSGVTYSEIFTTLDLPKSSVHRILKDLTGLGYLNFNPETKRYFGSLQLAALGAEVMSHFRLREHVRPHLLELHRETEHTTNLGVIDKAMGVFVDKIESQDFGIKLFSEIGKTFPLPCTGLGKALLAFASDGIRKAAVKATLKRFTEKTITAPKVLERELALIRKKGFALDNEEITRGIMCVSAPVFGLKGELAGAISITFPSYINDDRGIDVEIAAIKKHAALISRSLGHK